MVSEREAVLRERAAFSEGARWQRLKLCHADPNGRAHLTAYDESVYRFAFPKVSRPRVVPGSIFSYCIEDGMLRCRDPRHGDFWAACFYVPITDVALVADLLASPTELVDDSPAALPLQERPANG
jgi:hypothetical protein